jgi:hypothetical protein
MDVVLDMFTNGGRRLTQTLGGLIVLAMLVFVVFIVYRFVRNNRGRLRDTLLSVLQPAIAAPAIAAKTPPVVHGEYQSLTQLKMRDMERRMRSLETRASQLGQLVLGDAVLRNRNAHEPPAAAINIVGVPDAPAGIHPRSDE